jgi:hypothetical protein
MSYTKLSGRTTSDLMVALNEWDVNTAYRNFFTRKIQTLVFTSPYMCDGYAECPKNKIRLLIEFKRDVDLSDRRQMCEVLIQAIYYIKKFELDGKKLPTTIMLADKDEFVVLHTNDIINYLSIPLDWSIAPSSAASVKENQSVVKLLVDDEKINPFVFSVDQLDDVIEKIKDLTSNVKRLIPITNHNLTEVFNYFLKNILGKTSLSTNELANLFVQILINPVDNYLHPVNKISAIVTKSFGPVPVKKRNTYQSFFEHFKSEYNPKEKELLTSIIDRLIEDVIRRKQGEFFTPTIWVDKAHEYITSVFGNDWKEKYVVWDPAWGTGNLTRDYKFKELYCSTLNQSDIDTANQMGYNPEAIKFQFDFLNDFSDKLPQGLKSAIESGRKIIILMNPPYATSNDLDNVKSLTTKSKKGVSETKVKSRMLNEKLGTCSDQLYSQFIYKLYSDIENLVICTFSPPLLLTGNSFKKFRKKLNIESNFIKGFLMNSEHFADVSSWGLSFSIFSKSVNENNQVFNYDILDLDKDFNIETLGVKSLYNTDNKIPLNEWVKIKVQTNDQFPNFKSGLSIGDKNRKFNNYAYSYFVTNGNSVEKNDSNCYFIPGPPNNNKAGTLVTLSNFNKVCTTFAASSLISGNWVNKKDEYLSPNICIEGFDRFEKDSIINMLFSEKNGQSSLRKVSYKDKFWDIKNEFFWMSKNEILEIANTNNNTDLYNDARTDSDRYVYNLLFGEERIYDKLSPDAKLVLDKATELVKKSMQMREVFANDNNHLNSWDAGYAQLKLLWKQYYAEDFKEFRELYKNLEDRMRPLVYELGFLMK